jgi:mRNA-degrading endonuclease RelE of RelBE toxin-antitoxin system
MQSEVDETKWRIGYYDEEHESEILDKATSTKQLSKKWDHFVQDVTANPYHHTKPKRIVKLKDNTIFPKGTWRYRHDPLRVVYYPEGVKKIVYPLEVASATEVSYKKKSLK